MPALAELTTAFASAHTASPAATTIPSAPTACSDRARNAPMAATSQCPFVATGEVASTTAALNRGRIEGAL
jgi:hypothetical protein